MKMKLIDVGSNRDELNEPLGIEVLAGMIRHHFPTIVNVEMEYLQMTNGIIRNHDLIMDHDIIGISTKLYSLDRVKNILDIITKNYSIYERPLIIFGDLLATFAYEQLLNIYDDAICVLGEGEDALCGIIKVILDFPSSDLQQVKKIIISRNIPNIALRYNKKTILTRRAVVDLNKSVKPARDFLHQIIDKGGILRIEGSRGCPWGKCTYCAISAKYGYRGWRPFPVNKILDEMEELSNAGVISPYFTDEDFIGTDPDRGIRIADNILKAKEQGKIDEKLNFYVNIPIDIVLKYDNVLEKLKEAGLREVFIGVESGATTQIKRYGKRATKKRNINAIKKLGNMGFAIDIGFIMFDPEMSFSDLKESIDFIHSAGLIEHDARDIKKVRVEPKTELANKYRVEGIITSEFDINSLTYPYRFKDPLVQKIVDIFELWEQEYRETIYSLQGRMRGEIESETQRNDLKKALGKIRKIDFEFLENCINIIEKTPNNIESNIYNNKFYEKRDSLMKILQLEKI